MKNLSETRFVVTLAIATLTLTAFSLPAKAGDNKVYPGSACLPVSADSGNLLIRSRGRITALPELPWLATKCGGGVKKRNSLR